MELHQLRYFLAVVDEGTFTAAATSVGISQSGVSTQVQKLERELGIDLLDRSSHRVVLTPAGDRLVTPARAAIAAVEDAVAVANDIRGLVVGALRVVTVTGLTWPPLFDAIESVHRDHPGVDLRMSEGTSDDQIAAVREGRADIAIAAWPRERPEGVDSAVVFDDPLVAVVAATHPWTAEPRIRPDEIARADLIALPRGTGSRDALDGLLARAGATRVEPRWEVSSPASVRMLAARGIGVGVVSGTMARDWADLAPIPVDDPLARYRFGVVWQKRPSHAARALLRRLSHTAGKAISSPQREKRCSPTDDPPPNSTVVT